MADNKKKKTAKKGNFSAKKTNANVSSETDKKINSKAVAHSHSHKAAKKKTQTHHTHDEQNAKTPSENVTEQAPADFWKNIAIVLIALAILLIAVIAFMVLSDNGSGDNNNQNQSNIGLNNTDSNPDNGANENPNNNNNNNANPEDEPELSLVIVEDPNCANCEVDFFVDQISTNLFGNMKVEKIEFDSNTGESYIEELGAKQLPVYLFSSNLEERSDWAELQGAFLLVNIDGNDYYQLNPQIVPSKILIEAPPITETALIIGDENAPVVVFEFSDYECPFCAIAEGNEEMVASFAAQSGGNYEPPVPAIIENYVNDGLVKIVFYNMPIPSLHPDAEIAHMAALCANGQDMWLEYHQKLFDDRQEWISSSDKVETFKEYAVELGLDEDEFNECLDNEEYKDQLDEEIMLSQQLGVSGTPAFFVGREFISGAQDFAVFKSLIDAQLAEE